LKRHYLTILLCCAAFAFLVPHAASQTGGKGKKGTGSGTNSTAQPTAKSSANTVQWADLVNGGKLPYGSSVTLVGKLGDLTCGKTPISDVLDITAIAVSYAGQTSPAIAAAISDPNWTASLGSLSADTTVNLQLKVTGTISPALQAKIVDELLADPSFQAGLKLFVTTVNGQSTVTDFDRGAQLFLSVISDKSGALTKILQGLLPSCTVVTDVTTAAVKALQANPVPLLGLTQDMIDFGDRGVDGYDKNMTAGALFAFIKAAKNSYTKEQKALEGGNLKAAQNAAAEFQKAYQAVLPAFGGEVIAQLSQGVALSQSSTTQDLNKYAGFDAGALYAPRINELRGFYMVHIYPTGPVELETSGHIRIRDRFSIAFGESTGDLSSNGASRVKNDKAFVYGMGVRINKYFRLTVGGMVYRDAVGNRLLNEVFIGPSIDITALPGLKSAFASSSSKSTDATTPASAAPVITSLLPNSITASASAQTLTINGTGFQSGSTVTVGTTTVPATFVSSTQLTVSVTEASAQALPVNVTSGGKTSNSVNLQVN
jgi:hypothetical protein